MNYLAHLLLSGNIQETIMGNYVGDFVKGRLDPVKYQGINPDFVNGLKLHRYIDSYTDTNPLVRDAKHKIALRFGRISGIIVDIYFDYLLTKSFSNYTEEPLDAFCLRMYRLIKFNRQYIPENMTALTESMIKQDWLKSYQSLDGIALTFNRMSRRAPYLEPIKDATLELIDNEPFYEAKFLEFFPLLVQDSNRYLDGLYKI